LLDDALRRSGHYRHSAGRPYVQSQELFHLGAWRARRDSTIVEVEDFLYQEGAYLVELEPQLFHLVVERPPTRTPEEKRAVMAAARRRYNARRRAARGLG
jgi:hypothetical protein